MTLKAQASEPKTVGIFFRTNKDLNLKIKIAAYLKRISQQDLINQALQAYFEENPIDLSKIPDSA